MKSSTRTLAEQLCGLFVQRIRTRLLASGARLPSVRQCAQQHGVSPSTVVAAYEMLLAQGWVQARKNRGFFALNEPLSLVNKGNAAIHSVSTGSANPLAAPVEPVNATALIRSMFHAVSDKPQPGLGAFPPDWLDNTFLARALRTLTTTAQLKALSQQYGEPAGDLRLRKALADNLAGIHLGAPPAQIMTTLGATHALDIVSRALLRAGDAVMVDEPGWAIEFARLEALGMHILPVPRGPAGPDLAVMEQYCRTHAPKMFVSVSVLHNPTGYCLSPPCAHRVLQLANSYDFQIVEDDSYQHIAPAHATRLSVLDGLQRTIYISSFSKILAPNWRVGYLAAPAHLMERLLDTKLLSTLTTPALTEKAIALTLENGQLNRHAQRLVARLDLARARSVRLALEHGCHFAAPPAGLFGWVDTGVDTDRLAQRMLNAGFLLAPGALFHAQHQPSTLMRINFATTQVASFWKTFSAMRGSFAPGHD